MVDSSSRRAFSLDSRTVWVEQQLINGVLLPRDNLPLGPGEYCAQIQERHIGTPVLGKFRGPADHFNSFKSHLQTKTPSNNNSNALNYISSPIKNNVTSSPKKTDFMTIFHDHDERQPLDPNKRFCETPGSYLSQDPPLRSVNHNGVKSATVVHFGNVPSGDRSMLKVALPDYEVKYDSPQIKPVTKLGSFDRTKRVIKMGQKSYYDEGPRQSPSPSKHLQQASPTMSTGQGDTGGHKSVYEMRCSLVALPKLKTRQPEKLILKDISYGGKHKKQPLSDLTPSKINRAASVHVFDGIVAIPRKHQSAEYSKNAAAMSMDDYY